MKRLGDLKLLLFGIDGLSYDLIRSLMAGGSVPTMSALLGKGRLVPLRSTTPPHTALAWPSIFSGVNPGRHGIFQFWDTQSPDYSARIVTSGELGVEPIWKTLERHGVTVGVLNVPMTHPPYQPSGGYMISWPLSKTLRYTEPPELLRELKAARMHYHSDLVTMYDGSDGYFELALDYMRARTDTVLYLAKSRPVDALIVVYTEIDRISHYFWGGEAEPDPRVLQAYQAVDVELGRLVSELEDDATICVASDHGFGPCRAVWNIHRVLHEAGLLAASDAAAPHGFAPWFAGEDGEPAVDFSSTRVYMPTPGCFGLNINKKGRQCEGIVDDPEEEKALFREIEALMAAHRDPESGVAYGLTPRQEIYTGPLVDRAPDLILTEGPADVMVHPGFGSGSYVSPMQPAIHRMDGVFLAAGPAVEMASGSGKVEDVAPTICALLGLPVARGLDGDVLFALPSGVTYEVPAPYRPAGMTCFGPGDKQRIETSLRNLGYM